MPKLPPLRGLVRVNVHKFTLEVERLFSQFEPITSSLAGCDGEALP